MTISRLKAIIGADTKEFEEGMKRVRSGLRATADGASSLGKALTISVTLPLLALAKASVQSAVTMDSLMRGLQAVSGSAQAARAQLARLKEVAKLPGLGFEEAIQGSINLQAAGFSARQAEGALMSFGNALATVGKGKAELQGVTLALTQIAAKGKVSAEEINQLAERVPQIRKVMQAAFGTSNTELLQKAKITSEEFIRAIVAELDKLPKVTGGVKNAFENFHDTAKEALTSLGNALLPDVTRALARLEIGLKTFTAWWGKLPQTTRENYVRFAGIVAIAGPAAVGLGKVAGAVKSISEASALLAGSKGASFLMRLLGGVATTGLAGGIAAGFGGLYKVLSDNDKAVSDSRKKLYADSNAAEKLKPGYLKGQLELLKIQKEGVAALKKQAEEEKSWSPTLYERRKQKIEEINAALRQTYANIAEVRKAEQKPDAGKKAGDTRIDVAARIAAIEAAERLKKATEDAQQYIAGLQRAYYNLNNEGSVAEVMWERQNGILRGVNASLFQEALGIAKVTDARAKLMETQDAYLQLAKQLQEQAALSADATDLERLKYRLSEGDLQGLNQAQRSQLIIMQSLIQSKAKDAEITKSYSSLLSDLKEKLALGADATEEQRLAYRLLHDTVLSQVEPAQKQILLGLIREIAARDAAAEAAKKQAEAAKKAAADALALETKRLKIVSDIGAALSRRTQEALARLNNPKEEAFLNFLSDFQQSLDDLDATRAAEMVEKIKKAFGEISAIDAEFEQRTGFREYLADVQKRIRELTAGSEFERFTTQFLKFQDMGDKGFKLVQPFTPEQLKAMFDMAKQVQKIEEMQQLMQNVANGMKDVFNNALNDIFERGFGGFFNNVINGFRQMLQRMAAEYLSSMLVRAVGGLISNAIGGKAGKDFGAIFENFGGFKAGGGSVDAGRSYIVGERGPELFVPNSSGGIVPNHALAGGGNINIVMNIQTPDVAGFQQTERQMLSRLKNQIDHARRRSG